MKNRVAYIATLITLVFGVTVLLVSAHNFAGEYNAELSAELSQLSRVSAVALQASEETDAVVASLLEEHNLEAGLYAKISEAESDEALKRINPKISWDYAATPVNSEKIFAHKNAEGEATLYAIYRFEDGAFLHLSRSASTLWSVVEHRLSSYAMLLIGTCVIVFVALQIVLYRKQRLVTNIMNTLDEFSEGKFDARFARVKGESARQTAEYNAVIARIQDRIFSQRSRNHALSVVMNQMQNGIIAVDAKMHVILVTPVAKQLLGITGNPEGTPLENVSKDVNLLPVFNEAMQQEGVYMNEVAARAAVGRGHRPLRLYVSPMRQDDKVVGALAMVEDITELRRLEQVRTDFAANVSHELKTPLTSIKGFVETLMNGAIHKPEMAEKFLKIIMLEADRLTRLINDILSISKLESGSDEVAVERIRFDKMAYEVADMLSIHASEKKVTINAHMNKKPVYIIGNPDRVEQMLINLVENAIKYNKEGGSVTVQVFANESEASLTVSDTGIGIAEEHLPRMFERFYRVDKGRSRSMGGTGLGLAIVKHIIRTMNGEIEVHSKLGEGTEFLVTLPLAPHQDEPDIPDDYDDFDDFT